MPRKRRTLSAEEAALWSEVARTARPLRTTKRLPLIPSRPDRPGAGREDGGAAADSRKVVSKPARARAHHPQALLDRRTTRRVARGTISIDGRLDLHGCDQVEAHERLSRFVAAAQAQDWRLVLIITGKGGPGDLDRGVLRRQLPHWLSGARIRPFVSGFEQAHRKHGGAGAFYVRIRRGHGRL